MVSCRFKWPSSPDVLMYEQSDFLLEIDGVIPVQESEVLYTSEFVWCALNERDFLDANDTLKRVLNSETL